MDETISVRDHARTCEHGSFWPHRTEVKSAKWWQEPESLGGKEMILRQLGRSVWVEVGSGSDRRTALEAESE